MENGLPALLISALLMLCTVLMARGGFLGADAIGQSLRQSETRFEQQKHSDLTVTSSSIDGSGANITLTIQNDGQTPIADFAGMDVLVQYFAEGGTRYDKWLPYTSASLSGDSWTTGAFTNDVFEPRILNAGESMEVVARVNPVVGQGTTNLAVIGTEKGVQTQAYFPGPP